MSQSRKNRARNSKAEPTVSARAKSGDKQSRRTAIVLAAVVLVLILAIVGIIGYPTYVAPFRRTIITVDNINIRMDYFLKRLKLSGSDPIAMLTQLTNDQMIKLGAPKYGLSVSPSDIDQTMRSVFQSQSGNASATFSEPEFKEWYRQLLNETGLSDAEYRDITTVEILTSRLQEYLAARMPTIAEQAHLYLIAVETEKEAEDVRTRWAAGANFTALARELSIDKTSGANGGEIGWFPRGGILTPQLESEAFTLSTGNVSEPLPVVSDVQQADGTTAPTVVGYHLVMVPERADRELDTNALQVLRSKVVESWLVAERPNYNIKWHGLNDVFDSETYAWINYQLAKSKPASSSSSSTPGNPGK